MAHENMWLWTESSRYVLTHFDYKLLLSYITADGMKFNTENTERVTVGLRIIMCVVLL